MPKENT